MIGDLVRVGQLFFPIVTLTYISGCSLWDVSMNAPLLTLLAILILILNAYSVLNEYNAGTIEIEQFQDGRKRYSLSLKSDPEALDTKKRVTFDVDVSRD